MLIKITTYFTISNRDRQAKNQSEVVSNVNFCHSHHSTNGLNPTVGFFEKKYVDAPDGDENFDF